MTYRINPAFERFPKEATLVGLILSSFGELELTVCQCAQFALQANTSLLKTLYRIRSTSSRIDVADGLMRPSYEELGLLNEYEPVISRIRFCLTVRNQYAHCNWADHHEAGLFFADLQTSAKNQNFDHAYKHVDTALLTAQLDYAKMTLEWLRFMDCQLGLRQERIKDRDWPEPPSSTRPPLHNPASQHIPPWLSTELQAVHLKHALESEAGAHKPERLPSILKLTEEEWIAKYRKESRPLPGAE